MRRERAPSSGSRVAAAVLAFAALGLAAPAAAKQHTIVIDKMRFGPAATDLHAGDTVVWVNRDPVRHTATARDKSFDLDLPPRSSGTVTLRRAGAIAVSCRFHPAMKALLRVAR